MSWFLDYDGGQRNGSPVEGEFGEVPGSAASQNHGPGSCRSAPMVVTLAAPAHLSRTKSPLRCCVHLINAVNDQPESDKVSGRDAWLRMPGSDAWLARDL
jgi:hypothetical protein